MYYFQCILNFIVLIRNLVVTKNHYDNSFTYQFQNKHTETFLNCIYSEVYYDKTIETIRAIRPKFSDSPIRIFNFISSIYF